MFKIVFYLLSDFLPDAMMDLNKEIDVGGADEQEPVRTKRLRKSIDRYMVQRRSQEKLQRLMRTERNKLQKLLDKNAHERKMLKRRYETNEKN